MKKVSVLFILLFFINSCGNKKAVSPPNILFIIADDISRTSMGAYGCEFLETPSFDRIAREGVLFTNAYVCNPKCAPARATLLTGRNLSGQRLLTQNANREGSVDLSNFKQGVYLAYFEYNNHFSEIHKLLKK